MTRIAAVACRDIRQQNLCPGCAKCFATVTGREGGKNRYKGKEVNIKGMVG
jgi:hypothetical protein